MTRSTRRAQTLRLAALLLAIAVGPRAFAQAPYVYIGPTGNFTDPANWLTPPGMPPANQASTVLQFNNAGATAVVATQNIAPVFQLNGLVFNSVAGGLTVTNAAGNALQFVANGPTLPFVLQNGAAGATLGNTGAATFTADALVGGGGTGPVAVTSPVVFQGGGLTFAGFNNTTFSDTTAGGGISLPSAAVTITGNGVANALFTGTVSGSPASVTINTGATNLATGSVQLSGSANSYTAAGGIALQSGNLIVGGGAPLGAATNVLTVTGGTIRGTGATPNPIQLSGADLVFAGGGLMLNGVVSGGGGLRVLGVTPTTSILTLQNANTYTGPTVIGQSGLSAPALILGSTATTNGSILGTTAITVNGSNNLVGAVSTPGVLGLTNMTANSPDRVPTVPVTLNSGRIAYAAGAGANTETFGPVTVNGYGVLALTLGTGASAPTSTVLTVGNLTRTNNATVSLRGPVVGTGPTATNAQVTFANGPFAGLADPAGTAVPVVPWATAFGATAADLSHLVAPDGNGLRIIGDAESTPVAPNTDLVPAENNYVSGNAGPNPLAAGATVQVNSLRLGNPGVFASNLTVGGGAGSTLRVFSGAIVNYWPATISVPTLDFGPRTGYFSLGFPNTVTSSITGSAGVVVTADGPHTLTLGGTNTFTGGLTINGSVTVTFTADAQLGAAGGSVTLGGGALRYQGPSPFDFTRPLTLTTANGMIDVAATSTIVTLNSANVTGPGNLVKAGPGTLILTGAAGWTGGTIVTEGNVRFSDQASFGPGQIVLSSGTLQPLTAGAFTRDVAVNGVAAALNVGALDVTSSGVLSTLGISGITPTFTKQGTGTLTLTGNNTYAGSFTVAGGGVTLSGGGRLVNAVPLILAGGTTLTVDNTVQNHADRLGGPVTLQGGNFVYRGNAAASTETIGTLTAAIGASFVSLAPAAGSSARLTAAALHGTAGTVVFRGPGLGTTGANSSQVFFTTPPTLVGGLIPTALGDTDPAGGGSFLVGYSTTLGVINATPTTPTAVIQNAPPTNTPLDANILTAPTTVTRDAANTINSLTFSPGSTLNADTPPASTLTLTSGLIAAQAGAPSTVGSGLTLAVPTGTGYRVGTAGNLTIAGPLSGATATLTKVGTGTLTLAGANTFGGAVTVGAGTLSVTGSIATGTSAVTVASGGTLGGTGLVARPVTLASGGAVSPGTSVGELDFGTGTVTVQGGARYDFEYNATTGLTPGVTHDHLNGAGALDLTGLAAGSAWTINILPLILPPGAGPTTYTIATFAGGITGFVPATDQSKFAFAGLFGGTPTVGLTGTQLTLTFTPVPEPAHLLLLGAAALAVRFVRRHRRSS